MGINKVQINKNGNIETLIDLTNDTVTEDTLLEGITAHGANGNQIIGTMKNGGGSDLDALLEGKVATTMFVSNLLDIVDVDVKSYTDFEMLYLPNADVIYSGQFESCETLNAIYLPQTETIGHIAFNYCTTLETVYLPKTAYIDSCAFENCTSLKTLDLPQVAKIDSYAFENCTSLEQIHLPKVAEIGENCFKDCSSLEIVDLPTTIIEQFAFKNCLNLKAIVIRYKEGERPVLFHPLAVLGTKILDEDGNPLGTGFIYLPSYIREQWISDLATIMNTYMGFDIATATYLVNIVSRVLEDYTVDGTVTGELDESKI